jgi:hypothetical protein
VGCLVRMGQCSSDQDTIANFDAFPGLRMLTSGEAYCPVFLAFVIHTYCPDGKLPPLPPVTVHPDTAPKPLPNPKVECIHAPRVVGESMHTCLL